MSGGAIVFMVLSWTLVLGLLLFSYNRVLKKKKHHDPDSLGPRGPAERGAYEGKMPPPTDHYLRGGYAAVYVQRFIYL